MDSEKVGAILRTVGWVVLVTVAFAAVFSIVGTVVGTRFVFGTVDYVVDNLASRSGLSSFLVKGLVILGTIPFFWAVAQYTRNILGLLNMVSTSPLGFYRKKYGMIIVAYIGAFFLAMYFASLDAYAYKFCADTPEGIWTSDGPGKDPVYGVDVKPCSLGQIKTLRNSKGKLQAPEEIHIASVNNYRWFNGVTSQSLVWYDVLPDGDYRFFDRAGADPYTGEALRPVTHEVVQQLRQRQATKETSYKQKQAWQAAQESKSKELADLQMLVQNAQREFDGGNYQAAKDTCDQVLTKDRTNEGCRTVRQRASVKLAQQLVKQGQTQLERGQFDEALWSADEAIRLDPANPNAPKLKQFAVQMKPHSLN